VTQKKPLKRAIVFSPQKTEPKHGKLHNDLDFEKIRLIINTPPISSKKPEKARRHSCLVTRNNTIITKVEVQNLLKPSRSPPPQQISRKPTAESLLKPILQPPRLESDKLSNVVLVQNKLPAKMIKSKWKTGNDIINTQGKNPEMGRKFEGNIFTGNSKFSKEKKGIIPGLYNNIVFKQ